MKMHDHDQAPRRSWSGLLPSPPTQGSLFLSNLPDHDRKGHRLNVKDSYYDQDPPQHVIVNSRIQVGS